eukprot:1161198-Pelagomonas_calceolata.AAC.3
MVGGQGAWRDTEPGMLDFLDKQPCCLLANARTLWLLGRRARCLAGSKTWGCLISWRESWAKFASKCMHTQQLGSRARCAAGSKTQARLLP